MSANHQRVIDGHIHLDEDIEGPAINAARTLERQLVEANIDGAVVLHLEQQRWPVEEVAEAIGHPQSSRAVANACAKNPYPIEIPCHRVIRSDGGLGGYSGLGGVTKKKQLLINEKTQSNS